MEIAGNGRDSDQFVNGSKILSLLTTLVASLDSRLEKYYYKLVGDGKESLSTLLGVDNVHFQCVLSLAGLHNVSKKECRIGDNWRYLDPCEIVPCNFKVNDGLKPRRTKEHFVAIGRGSGGGFVGTEAISLFGSSKAIDCGC